MEPASDLKFESMGGDFFTTVVTVPKCRINPKNNYTVCTV